MTEKIKTVLRDNVFEAVIIALLGIIITMGGYYVNRLTQIQDEMGKTLNRIDNQQHNVVRVLLSDPDTQPVEREEMKTYLWPTRGGNITK